MTGTTAVFVPPFCPRSTCRYHTCSVGWRWVRHGTYATLCSTRRHQRYRCRQCGSTFSETAFLNTYCAKRPHLLVPLAHRLLACSGYRQMARELGCSASSLMRQAARIGRQALLHLAGRLPREALQEPLVVDGFESFAFSQYHPCHVNLAVGSRSHYTYGFTFSPLRRKGRMTERQRRRRARLEARHGRPHPQALERGTAQAVAMAAPVPQAVVIRSDEHPAYPRAFRRLAHLEVTHERTPSVQARTARNPLFPVNLVDLLIRHNSANHKRETIAFSKHPQALIERIAWLLAWRNCCKPFSEQHGGGTPAMRAGLLKAPLTVAAMLRWRLFPERVAMPQAWVDYYHRLEHVPGTTRARRHTLRFAF